MPRVLVGTAGWRLPVDRSGFAADGSHLTRYASRFPAVEINSSFYRPHRPATYARWASEVPADFRFSVKLPKTITHERRLVGAYELLDAFVGEVSQLGEKLGCILVQLPPKLELDPAAADDFFAGMRARIRIEIACEPRHPSWFEPDAGALLERHRVARVAADPACVPAAAEPGGWRGFAYYRLHGSPRMYYSTYSADYLRGLAMALRADRDAGRDAWCIFDNTALGAAAENALDLLRELDHPT